MTQGIKRIGIYFTFETRKEATAFRDRLIELRWMDPTDEGDDLATQVYLRIDAGNYDLMMKLHELACDLNGLVECK